MIWLKYINLNEQTQIFVYVLSKFFVVCSTAFRLMKIAHTGACFKTIFDIQYIWSPQVFGHDNRFQISVFQQGSDKECWQEQRE